MESVGMSDVMFGESTGFSVSAPANSELNGRAVAVLDSNSTSCTQRTTNGFATVARMSRPDKGDVSIRGGKEEGGKGYVEAEIKFTWDSKAPSGSSGKEKTRND